MSEALFYHLERRRLEDVLPGLLEKTVERGWRALVRVDTAERASAIDALLWTYNDESFLPHAISGDGEARRQPILITVEPDSQSGANILFIVGGARMPDWEEARRTFTRVVVLFDGRDPDAVSAARAGSGAATDAGFETTYWRQSEAGKWEKRK